MYMYVYIHVQEWKHMFQCLLCVQVESSESEREREEEEEEEEDGESEEEEEEEEELEGEVMSSRSLRSQKRRQVTRQRRSGRLHQKAKAQPNETKKTTKQKAKKPPPKQQVAAPAVKAKKKLKLGPLPPVSKAESIVSAIIELRCSRGSRGGSGAVRRGQRGLEMQLCQALWEEVSDHTSSWPFTEPVKKKEVSSQLAQLASDSSFMTAHQS